MPPLYERPHAVIDPLVLTFAEVDYSSASNNFSGWYDAPNYPNWGAFAALQADGSITAWGSSSLGGTNPYPTP
jgi:hypothetical protein